MESETCAIFVFYAALMRYEKTPFEGEREELLELADHLQEAALANGETGLYVVRPLPYPPEGRSS